MKQCRRFGSQHDHFGKRVQINYRGQARYGTTIGGYLSICAYLIIWALALCEIWACFYDQKHKETVIREQFSSPNEVAFNITYESGFPSFSIQTWVEEEGSSTYNNDKYINFYFEAYTPEGKIRVDAIPCKDAINKYILNEESRQSIEDLYGNSIKQFVCPDTPYFTIWEKYFYFYKDFRAQSDIFYIHVYFKSKYDYLASET